MARYIDAERFFDDFTELRDYEYASNEYNADVAPVVHAHWIMPRYDDGMSDPVYYQVRCSKCGFNLDPQTWLQELHQYGADKHCPKCGAKMEEEK